MAGKKPDWNRCVLALVPDRTGSMIDLSPYGNHAALATAANQPTLVNDGVNINKSLSFDGAASPNNDYLVVADDASIQLTGLYSIIFTIKPNSFAAAMIIYSKYISVANRFHLITGSGANAGKLYIYHNASFNLSTYPMQLNVFNNVGLSYNGTNVYHYLNGAVNSFGALAPISGAIGADLRIGSYYNAAYPLNGNIQYFFIFNYALDADEHHYMNKYLPTWLPRGSK